MKINIKQAAIAIAVGILIPFAASADVIGASLWKKVGNALFPLSTAWDVGSTSTPVANGFFGNLNVSGNCAGCGVSATSGIFTNIQWQNATGTNSIFTNATATNFYAPTGKIDNFTFIQATGQEVTTTDIILLGPITGSLIPTTTATYNIGSPSFSWNNIFASGTINGVNESLTNNLTVPNVTTTNLFSSTSIQSVGTYLSSGALAANIGTKSTYTGINYKDGVGSNLILNPSADNGSGFTAGNFNISNTGGAHNIGNMDGIFVNNLSGNTATGVVNAANALEASVSVLGPTTTNASGILVDGFESVSSSGTAFSGIRTNIQASGNAWTNLYSLYLPSLIGSGSPTNVYGIRVDAPGLGVNRWTFADSGGNNYLAGSTSFGNNTVPGFTIDDQGTLGVSSTATISSTTLIKGALTVNNAVTLGASVLNPIVFNGEIQSDFVPITDNTYNLGTAPNRWKSIHVGPGSVWVHNDNSNVNWEKLDFSSTTAQLITDSATPLQLTTGANPGLQIDTSGNIILGNVSSTLTALGTSSFATTTAASSSITTANIGTLNVANCSGCENGGALLNANNIFTGNNTFNGTTTLATTTITNGTSANFNATSLSFGTANGTSVTTTNLSAQSGVVNFTGATITGLSTANLSDNNTLVKLAANQTFSGTNIFNATTTFATTTMTSTTITTANIGTLNLTTAPGLAFLANNQTFTGQNTFASTTLATTTIKGPIIISPPARSDIPSGFAYNDLLFNEPQHTNIPNLVYAPISIFGGGQIVNFASSSSGYQTMFITGPTITATVTGTTSDASTLVIGGPPQAGSKETFTTSHALWVQNGLAEFGGGASTTALNVNGLSVKPVLTATSTSLGGGLLTVGTCSTVTSSVPGATTQMVCNPSPQTYPGDGNFWECYVSSVNVVTTKICATATLTPTASLYNIRVNQ